MTKGREPVLNLSGGGGGLAPEGGGSAEVHVVKQVKVSN